MRKITMLRYSGVPRYVAGLVFGLAVGFASLTLLPAAAQGGLPAGIEWYGILEDGLAEAARTDRPILLLSAAPQCGGVSGLW
jgi:hypothetical protein